MFSRIHSKKLCDGLLELCRTYGIVIDREDVLFPTTCSLVLESYYEHVRINQIAIKITSIWFSSDSSEITEKVKDILRNSGYPHLSGKFSALSEMIENRALEVIY